MSSKYLYKLSSRLTATPARFQLVRPVAAATQTPTFRRTYADNPIAQGSAASSSQESDVNSSRATDDPSTTEHGGSLAKPVSGSGDQMGTSEEGDAPMKKGDPSEPASKKRAKIEEAGKTPLDAADK